MLHMKAASASAWTDVGVGVLFFVGFLFLAILAPLAYGYVPKGFKDFVMDHFGWFFFSGIILLLIWQNS